VRTNQLKNIFHVRQFLNLYILKLVGCKRFTVGMRTCIETHKAHTMAFCKCFALVICGSRLKNIRIGC
jgi:hypothetical protein